MADESGEKRKKTLEDGEIVTERRFGRRGALGMLGATVAGAAVASVGMAFASPKQAEAQSDSDTGRYADPAGRGRTGVTDSDGGPNADRVGHGRGRGRTGCTDSDGGQYADPAGNGRCQRNCSDSDGGQYMDPAGRGRRC